MVRLLVPGRLCNYRERYKNSEQGEHSLEICLGRVVDILEASGAFDPGSSPGRGVKQRVINPPIPFIPVLTRVLMFLFCTCLLNNFSPFIFNTQPSKFRPEHGMHKRFGLVQE